MQDVISVLEKPTLLIMFIVVVCKELLTNMCHCVRHSKNQCKNPPYALRTEMQTQAEVRHT